MMAQANSKMRKKVPRQHPVVLLWWQQYPRREPGCRDCARSVQARLPTERGGGGGPQHPLGGSMEVFMTANIT